LLAFFNQYPDEAKFFTGDGQNLMFIEMTWTFSPQNQTKRQKVEKRATEKEMEKASADLEKLGIGDEKGESKNSDDSNSSDEDVDVGDEVLIKKN